MNIILPDKMIWRKIYKNAKCLICGYYEDIDHDTRLCDECTEYYKNITESEE